MDGNAFVWLVVGSMTTFAVVLGAVTWFTHER
jgi:hypothetical protein